MKPSGAPATKGISAETFHFSCLRAAGLTFAVVAAIIEPITASTKTGMKDLGHGGVDVTG
jgi:hypothetical protein